MALGLKLVLTLSIAKKYGLHDLGVFSIFQAILITSVFLVGFEFYSYFNREVIRSFSEEDIFTYLNFHAIAIVGAVLFWLLPIYYTLKVFLADELICVYLLIIFTEYINTEIYRYLISLKMPIHANLNLLIRNGLLGGVLLVITFLNLKIVFSEIFYIWVILECFGLVHGSFLIFKKLPSRKYKFVLSFKKLKDVFRTIVPMYVASFCIKGIEHIDKFLIDFFLGKDLLGVYSLFFSIASVVQIICYSAVVIEAFPELIERKNTADFEIKVAELRKSLIAWSIGISVILAAVIYPLLMYLNKSVYYDYIGIFIIMLISNIILSISWSFHYQLYVGGYENMVLKSSLLQFFVLTLLLIVAIPYYGLTGAVLSVLMATLIGCFAKQYFVKVANTIQVERT